MSKKAGTPKTVGLSNYTNETFRMISDPADNIISGPVFFGTAGEALSRGDVVYIASDDKYYKAKADSYTTMPVVAMASTDMAVGSVDIFVDITAYVGNNSWNWTKGGILYVSASTAGAMTQTAPAVSTNLVQIVGYATFQTTIKFNPSLDIGEV
jgi:hypothetical protein